MDHHTKEFIIRSVIANLCFVTVVWAIILLSFRSRRMNEIKERKREEIAEDRKALVEKLAENIKGTADEINRLMAEKCPENNMRFSVSSPTDEDLIKNDKVSIRVNFDDSALAVIEIVIIFAPGSLAKSAGYLLRVANSEERLGGKGIDDDLWQITGKVRTCLLKRYASV